MKRIVFKILLALPLIAPGGAWAGSDGYKRMARELVKGLSSLKSPRVAVLAFPYLNGFENSGSSIVCERLATRLADHKSVRLVERNLIKKLLEEQKLSETGVLDPDSTKKIGRLLSVDVIVTGTLNDLSTGQVEVNARALVTESGEVLSASQEIVPRSWTDSSRPPKIRREALPPPESNLEAENEMIEIGVPGPRGRSSGRR